MNDRDKIIDRIKKCLALSTSSNEHEAAAALRQAQKLMDAHSVTTQDIQASDCGEQRAKSGAKSKPVIWEAVLASRIGKAFGCQVIFASGWWSRRGEWVFIGVNPAPEVAHYAFNVLHRQARRAREVHVKTALKRCGPASKTRRADIFCEGWVRAASSLLEAFAVGEQQSDAINAFIAQKHPNLSDLNPKNRITGKGIKPREYNDFAAGAASGKDATLNRGIGGNGIRPALETSGAAI